MSENTTTTAPAGAAGSFAWNNNGLPTLAEAREQLQTARRTLFLAMATMPDDLIVAGGGKLGECAGQLDRLIYELLINCR